MTRKILCLIPALLLICSLGAAWAIPMPEVNYVFEGQSGEFWRYQFIVTNTSDDTAGDAGFDLYDLLLRFDGVPGLSKINNDPMPAGWDFAIYMGDPSFPGAFISLTSLAPGVPPAGADIAPGQSLGGFVFEFDAELEKIFFDATIANPEDPDNPIYFADNAATPGNGVPIPEPATLALVSVGLVGIGLYTRRKRIH